MKKRISSPDLVRTNFGEMPVQASVTSDDVVTDRQRPRVTRSRPPDVKHAKPADRLQLFQALIEGAKDYGIFMLDPEGFILTWNEGASRLKGYSESEILGRHFSCFYTADDVAAGRPEDCLRIARAEGKFEEEGWRVRQDGSRFWASILITTLYDKNGNPRGFSKLTRDNTERKRADERVLHSECSLRLLADSMPQIMWTARPNGEVDYVNQRWYEFTGSVKEPTPDELWEPFLHPDDVQSS